MSQELSHVLARAVAKASAAVANAWRSATGNQASSYRPEAHYMRGPGPKWRAKHAQVSANSMSNFWMALVAAQTAAADTKPADRRQRILSVVGGIAIASLIGGGLFIAAALTLGHPG